MPLVFEPPDSGSALRQGEIINDVYEFQPERQPSTSEQDTPPTFIPLRHPTVMVMSPDCDLLQDYNERSTLEVGPGVTNVDLVNPRLIPHVLLCEIYSTEEIENLTPQGQLRRQLRRNQLERYHRLQAAPIGNPEVGSLNDLYLDFKKTLSVPTRILYEALSNSQATRIAVMPPVYMHDLMHRFYGFQSRVGVPE